MATVRIPPWGRQWVYFRHESDEAIKVRFTVAGVTGGWVELVAAGLPDSPDPDNPLPAYRILVAGPEATGNPGGTQVVALGDNPVEAATVGTEIAAGRGNIRCSR